MALPRKSHLAHKAEGINALIKHRFTEAELQEKLKRSGVLGQRKKGMEVATLEGQRQQAEANGDHDKAAELAQQIKELRTTKLAWGTSITMPGGTNGISVTNNQQQQRLAELNKINRKLNTQTIRRAQLAERKAAVERQAAVDRGEAVADPFARVKVMPKTHFNADNLPMQHTVAVKKEPSTETKPKEDPGTSLHESEMAALVAKRADDVLGYEYAPPPFWAAFGAYTTADGKTKSRFKTKLTEDEILHNLDCGITVVVDKAYNEKWKDYPMKYPSN